METLLALVEPGERVLIPDPAWPNYEMIAAAVGAEIVRYPLDRGGDYEPDLDSLAELAARSDAKVLLINSPGNPTGAVWSREAIERSHEIAREHDLYLLSDELYEEILLRGRARQPGGARRGRAGSRRLQRLEDLCDDRLAARVPRLLVGACRADRQGAGAGVSCAAAVSQKAAEAALAGPRDCVAEMREAYRARRDLTVVALRETGLFVSEPQGAFYALADVDRQAWTRSSSPGGS